MTQIAILILAAGASSRMDGLDKLMQDANGTPLLARVIGRAMATGHPTFVTLPDLLHPRARLVRSCGATPVPVADHASGMGASIRAGVAALPDLIPAVMILPGDMPDLLTQDLQDLARASRNAPGSIIRATTPAGVPGHPVIFPADLFAKLQSISGDQGARQVAKAHAMRLRPLIISGNRAICDLDTPQDWAAWRAANPSRMEKSSGD